MPTVVRRTSEIGDPRLLRIPLPEPGTQPFSRLSALAFQGLNAELVHRVDDVGSVPGSFEPGTGKPSTYRVMADGVPGYRFNTQGPATIYDAPTLYQAAAGGTPRTFIVVARFDRLPDSAVAGGAAYAQLLRSDLGGNFGLSVRSINSSANPGLVNGTLGSGNGFIYGPAMPNDGRLHFFALTYVGQTVRLYFDNAVSEVTAANPITPDTRSLIGYNTSGADYTIVEASLYSTGLTPAQIAEKRAHYRALYQF